jgi:hypothetical protein
MIAFWLPLWSMIDVNNGFAFLLLVFVFFLSISIAVRFVPSKLALADLVVLNDLFVRIAGIEGYAIPDEWLVASRLIVARRRLNKWRWSATLFTFNCHRRPNRSSATILHCRSTFCVKAPIPCTVTGEWPSTNFTNG